MYSFNLSEYDLRRVIDLRESSNQFSVFSIPKDTRRCVI